jgi:hypothetical protein
VIGIEPAMLGVPAFFCFSDSHHGTTMP